MALNGGGRQRRCSGDSGAAQVGMVHHPLARAMALLTRQTLPGRNRPADQVEAGRPNQHSVLEAVVKGG